MIDIPQQIPEQIRDLAEKNFEKAREAFLGFIGAAQKATGAAEALPSSAKEAVTKAITFAESNVNAAFDLAQKLLHAKDVQEIFTIQTEFAKNQLQAIQSQAKEFGELAQSAFMVQPPPDRSAEIPATPDTMPKADAPKQ
jgi:phasin